MRAATNATPIADLLRNQYETSYRRSHRESVILRGPFNTFWVTRPKNKDPAIDKKDRHCSGFDYRQADVR
jgi:hypothetical protein